MHSLAELFPAEGHRFHLTLRRASPRDFFEDKDASGAVREEREHWLGLPGSRYHSLLPAGRPLLAEATALAREWGASVETSDDCRALGRAWEPDFLLMGRDDASVMRLMGGALCFPSGWALEEKLGHDLAFIHGPVPGLNQAIGAPIDRFIGGLKPGVAFLRDNWGLAATPERNLHPSRELPAPSEPVDLSKLWLRVEHQAMVALPESRGALFAIRIALHRLDEIVEISSVRAGLRHALQTMPDELAAYKRIDGVRAGLIEVLGF